MTSPRVAAAVVGLLAASLAGCDLGHPGGFTARSNSYCAQTTRAIHALATPTTPKAHLQYATDRYTDVEKLVSEMTDSALPAGAAGEQLRAGWLRPARASLTEGRSVLAKLRAAVNGADQAALGTGFTASLAIGTQGVDTALLRQRGLTSCAAVFEPTTPV